MSPSAATAGVATESLSQHTIMLTPIELHVQPQLQEGGQLGPAQQLPYDTVAGVTVDAACNLMVHSFPLESGGCCSSASRVQRNLTLPCSNSQQAESLRLRLLARLDGRPDGPVPRRHLLVLVNPFSGRRQGRAHLATSRDSPGPPRGGYVPLAFAKVNRFCMALLYGRRARRALNRSKRRFPARAVMKMRGATLEEVETTHAGHAHDCPGPPGAFNRPQRFPQ